jgi:uncharacterized protein (TIGR03435 family)
MRKSHPTLVVVLLCATLAAQETTPSFDVASVKPAAGRRMQVSVSQVTFQGGRFTGRNQTARRLIIYAYGLPTARVVGGPGWIDSDAFDIEARTAATTSNEEARLMVRALLRERFRLDVHREMRDGTVYTLRRVRGDRLGPQLAPSTVDCTNGGPAVTPQRKGEPVAGRPRRCAIETFSDRGSTTHRAAVPIAELARALSTRLGTRVVDETGLAGRYDIDLRFAPDTLVTGRPSEWPELLPAVQAQLGLKLQPSNAPLEFLVIDRIERPSTD